LCDAYVAAAAQAEYEAAVARGDGAALAEVSEGSADVFRMSLGNVLRNTAVTVRAPRAGVMLVRLCDAERHTHTRSCSITRSSSTAGGTQHGC
jgi:hypothetical protein